MNKIVIAGGTGFLGTSLVAHFKQRTDRVVILTRGRPHSDGIVKYVNWDGKSIGPWVGELESADVLINLNGKSVDCRYTDKNKELIYSSRLDATAVLGKAIQQLINPPALWINASSATIYRHSEDKDMDEFSGELGTGFSVDVCQKWEDRFNRSEVANTRKIIIRTAIVLGKNGALKPLRILARLGLGGKQGSGKQYFSWLHEEDFVSIIDFFIKHQNTSGVYNVAAPTPVPNQYFMRVLQAAIGVPFGIPLPKALLEFGALLINTETELILKSRRVVPKRLLDAGFHFKFENIEAALHDLIRN
jgi:uncharacterized protein